MGMKPLISVIVPVYNVQEYLDECIASILNQTYRNIELVLVNDASTDNSEAICMRWRDNDTRVVYISQDKNGGLSATRNRGVLCAGGLFLLFVDSDDYIVEDAVEKMYVAMHDNPEVDLVIANNCVLTKKGDLIQNKEYEREIITGKEAIKRIVYDYKDNSKSFSVMSCNKLIRKSLFNNISFPEGKEFEDTGIIGPLVDQCNKIAIIPDYLYVYRKRDGSITDTITSKSIEDYLFNRDYFATYIEETHPEWKDDMMIVRLSDYIVAYYELVLLYNQKSTKSLKKKIREYVCSSRSMIKKFRMKKRLFAQGIIYVPWMIDLLFNISKWLNKNFRK